MPQINRVSSKYAFSNGIDELQRRQLSLARAQEQLTSGKRVVRASDDPTAAARAERALATVSRADSNLRALEASRNAMVLSEAALGDATALLQEARELLVASGNQTYTDAERDVLGDRVRSLRAQLLVVANRDDGSGGYLFAGQGARTAPFVDGLQGVRFAGQSGDQMVASETPLPITMDGRLAWAAGRTGNGVFETLPGNPPSSTAWIDGGQVANPSALTGDSYRVAIDGGNAVVDRLAQGGGVAATTTLPLQIGVALEVDGMAFTIRGAPAQGDTFSIKPSTPSLNVFDVLDRAVVYLKSPGLNTAQRAQAISTGLRDMDNSLSLVMSARSRAGAALTGIDQTESRIADLRLYGQKERSAAEDLDMTEAVSDFKNQQTGYEAALRSYALVQRMSLFDFING